MSRSPSSRFTDRRRRWTLALAYAFLVASCDSPFAPDVQEVGRIDITPPVLQLVMGGTANLSARVYDVADQLLVTAKVFWSTQDASVVTVSQEGMVTAVGPGTAQIAASSGGQSRTIAVTVDQRPIQLIRVTPPAGNVPVGQTLPLLAEALDGNGDVLNRLLTWSSDNPGVATVNNSGVVTGVSVGTAMVSASGEGKVGTSSITVLPTPVATIAVSPNGGSVPAGTTLQLTATPRDAGGQPLTGRQLSWQSSNDAVATVSLSGLVTAISPGSVTITVTAPGGGAGGTSPSTTVTVTVLLTPVASAVIVPSPASVQVGQTVNLIVNLFDAGGEPLSAAGRNVAWSTSSTAIATVSTSGVASGVAVGVATVTATITTPGQANPVQASVQLTVSNQPVVTVVVTPNPATVHAGSAYARLFSAATLDGAGQPLSRSVIWTSSNQAIATVSETTGLVTGVSPGAVQIRATSEGVPGVANVTVDLVPVADVQVTPPSASLTPPEQLQLSAAPRDSAGNVITGAALGGRVTGWLSSNPAAVTVTGTGMISAVAQGASTVTATIAGIVGQSAITVGAVPIATITVTPTPQPVTLGSTQQLTPTARDQFGNILSGRTYTWATANPAVATVDQNGLVSAVGIGGPVAITASAEGKVGTAQISVVPRPATKLTLVTQPPAVAQSGVAFGQQPSVQLQDAVDVSVAQAGVVVTASIASGTGSVTGTATATTNASGLATFTTLGIAGPAGAYTIAFNAPSLTGVTSGAVVLGAGGASQLAVSTQPSAAAQNAVAFPQQPAVRLLDASSNPVAQAGVVITASIASGTGTLGGAVTATTNGAGIATFTNLSITGTAGPFTLSFAAGGLGSTTSDAITLSAGADASLAMVTQPSASATNAVALGTQPAVRVTDSGGNAVAGAGVMVTAALTGGGATLGGTVTVATNGAGVATFTDLAITGTVGSYTLQFTSGALTPVTSNAIVLAAGTATQLAITTQPSATPRNGIAFPVQPVIQLRDVSGNDVAQAGVVIGAAITAPGTGTLGGTLTATTNASGVATFSGLMITGTTGTRTLTFTSAPLTSVTSGSIDLQAGTATQLALTTPPPATATSGEVFVSATVVQLLDAQGNNVPQSGVPVTAAIATGSGATLSGGTATTNGSGAAMFATLTLTGTAGAYTLNFASGGLTPVVSGTITLSAGTGAKLAVTTQPSATVQNAVAFPVQPVLQLQDASSNPVNLAGVQVFAVIASGGGSLGGSSSATTNASGVATFTDLAITGTTGDRTLLFSAAGYLPVSSGTITVTAGAATSVAINTQPSSSVQSGVPFVQQPVILVRDVSNNPVAGVVVTAAIASGAGTLGGTLAATTNASGVATFTNLAITGAVGNRTLGFTIPGPITATSVTVSVAAGNPASMTMLGQPSATATNDVAFAAQPQVQVNDASGNGVPGVDVTASIATGGGTLGGTLIATTNAAGTAVFTNLKITGAIGSRTIGFSGASLTTTSNAVDVTVGAPTSFLVTRQPSTPAANDAAFATQPQVTITDVSGNPIIGEVVTASISSGAGVLGGTATATTNAAGVATWTDLKITGTVGDRTLGFSGASLSANSSTVSVTPGAVTQLALTTPPSSSVTSGVAFAQQPVVQLRDISSNNVATAGTAVTAAIASGAGTLGGTLSVNTDGTGAATFTNLAISGVVGDRTLSFGITVPAAISVTSGTVSVGAGTPTSLTISTQPSASVVNDVAFAQQPVIHLTDASTNPVSGVVVTATIATGAGTLGGTLTATTDAAGNATFTNLKITGAVGDRTLTFNSGVLSATSATVSVTVGSATSLVVSQQPSSSVANDVAFGTQPSVTLTDVSGNPVAGVAVTAAVATGFGSLGGTANATTNGAGVAAWTNLKITGVVGDRTLSFTGASLSVNSSTITVTPGAVTQLAVTTQPSSSVSSGVAFPTQPAVRLQDISGNDVATAGTTVTAAVATGAGTLGGTLTANTDGTGTATFTDLMLTGTVGDRTLSFSITVPAAISVTSATVTVAAGAPTSLTVTTQPSASVANNTIFPQQPVIQVNDGSGNGVAGVVVTASIATGAGTLGGTLTATTDGTGAATFSNLRITGVVGDRTIGFSGASLSGSSNTVSVTVGTATSLSVTQQPTSPVANDVVFPAQPKVLITDGSGNPVSGVVVTAAIFSGGGVLGGTVDATTDGTGTATWTDLKITGTIGDRTLSFSGASLTDNSGTVSVTFGAGKALTIETQPSATAVNDVALAQQPVIQVRDISGNAVATSGIQVDVAIATGGGVLGGTTSVNTDNNGVVTFTNLKITGLVGARTLEFTAAGMTSATSGTITVSAGAATQLTITVQPSAAATSGVAFAQQPVIQLRDVSGNLVSQPGVGVTVTIASGAGGSLSGSQTVNTAADGSATFTDIGITGSDTFTLQFAAGALTPVVSNGIAVTP